MLGPDWGTHVDGQELRADGEAFKQKLSPTQTFDDWKKRVGIVYEGLFGHFGVIVDGCDRLIQSHTVYRDTYFL